MRIVECAAPSVIKSKKCAPGETKALLVAFAKSGAEYAIVEDWDYTSEFSAATAFERARLRLRLKNIRVFAANGKVYLQNMEVKK